MRHSTILWLVILPATAMAQWSGFPIATGTNKSYYSVFATYRPASQLWWAASERYMVVDQLPSAADDLTESFTVSAGYSNLVVVTNSTTYTNKCLITSNASVTLNLGTPSTWSNFGDYVYSYSDTTGTYTATSQVMLSQEFFAYLDEEFGDDDRYPQQFNVFDTFVSTNVSSNGYFNEYFKQLSGTNAPPYLPWETKVGCFYRNGIGYTTNRYTNAWGFVEEFQNVNNVYRFACYTAEPLRVGKWLLCEAHYTGAWVRVNIGSFDRNYFATNERPVIRYTVGGTNVFTGSPPFTLQGDILDLNAWTNQPNNPMEQPLITTSEVVAVTSTNAMRLSLPWASITSMTCAVNGFNTGDVAAVFWTNNVSNYAAYATWNPHRLEPVMFDERQATFNALRWTGRERTRPYGNAPAGYYVTWTNTGEAANYYEWYGHAETWADAKTACAGATPTVTTNLSGPYVGTYAEYSAGGGDYQYEAWAYARSGNPRIQGMATNWGHSVDYYFRPVAFTPGGVTAPVYDDLGSGYVSNVFQFAAHAPEQTNAVVVATNTIGQISFPSVWCDDPTGASPTSRGYMDGGNPKAVIKWDGTNGFLYK